MERLLAILGFVVLMGGKIASGTTSIASPIGAIDATTYDERRDVDTITDSEIKKILVDLSTRNFQPDDTVLVSLIVRSIRDAEKLNSDSTRSSIEAGAKKAQRFVADVTAAYTQAIFRANNAHEAQETLRRFQDTVQRIVDYSKNVQSDSNERK